MEKIFNAFELLEGDDILNGFDLRYEDCARYPDEVSLKNAVISDYEADVRKSREEFGVSIEKEKEIAKKHLYYFAALALAKRRKRLESLEEELSQYGTISEKDRARFDDLYGRLKIAEEKLDSICPEDCLEDCSEEFDENLEEEKQI